MNMRSDYSVLKQDALQRMQRSKPNPVVIGLIVFLLTWVLQYLTRGVLGLNFTITLPQERLVTQEQIMEFYESVYQAYVDHFHPSVFAWILTAALVTMNVMVNVGHTIFALHTVREEKAEYGNLLDGFSIILRVLALSLIRGCLIYLGLVLFVVPGVWLIYRYRQAMYLLIDHPDRSPVACLRASASLMQGHKWELARLDLSFLGWLVLSWFLMWTLFIPASVVLEPYFQLTYANYYRSLVGESVPPKGTPQLPEEDEGDSEK